MIKIPDEVRKAIDKTSPVCIATSGKNGIPNIVYITYLKIYDENTVVIADNKFNKTEKNLDENPFISFVVLDPDTRKSYQIKGSTECYKAGEKYDYAVEWVHVKHPQMTPKAAFYIDVNEIYCGAEKLI